MIPIPSQSLFALALFALVVSFGSGMAFAKRYREVDGVALLLLALACGWLLFEYAGLSGLSFLAGGGLAIITLIDFLRRWLDPV